MVEKGREGAKGKGKGAEERRERNAEPTSSIASRTAIRYFTVFGVHPLSARFEREIHIYVNEKEAGRRPTEGERERKVVMRHRRPPSLTRSHSNMLIPLPRRRSPSPSSEDTDTTIMAGRPFRRGRFS